MIEYVVKRDGTVEKFSADKLNRWAEYATEVGGNWSDVALSTLKRLSNKCSTQDILQTMIDTCLYKETIEYSRIASRLEFAKVRKNMDYILNVNDSNSFKDILNTYLEWDIWDEETLPNYNPLWEEWYTELKNTRLEYWQVKQWGDKYACKIQDHTIETPHIGVLGIALAIHGDTDNAFNLAKALIEGKINLPTPALNGCRNGDFNTISCCVISCGDTTDSIGVANHIAYSMTAKKAGIGIEMTTRSKGSPVKGGRVKHLGKHPIYKMIDRSVKTLTQITRGGNATTTVTCLDPEIEEVILWKSQRSDIETRIDKLDYSFAYNNAFVEAVVNDKEWFLFDYKEASEVYDWFYKPVSTYDEALAFSKKYPCKTIKARDLLKLFLTTRQESGRFYDVNITRMNEHTPFLDYIRQSNLCMETGLPTKPYKDMQDLCSVESVGETAFCSLGAFNVGKMALEEYEVLAELGLRTVDILIDRAPMMEASMKTSIMKRRSIGFGITGLANYLYQNGLDYDGSDESLDAVQKLCEHHYFYLLKASQKLSQESNFKVEGIKEDWLPIDTAMSESLSGLDWESLRGKGRKHSVLVAHMPTESSAVFSSAVNGLYPPREAVVNKKSRKGLVQYICEDFDKTKNLLAWGVDNIIMSKYYGRVQDYTDQGISCDFYSDAEVRGGAKASMSQLMREWVLHTKLGNKTKYYLNTRDFNGGSVQNVLASTATEEDGCETCKL